MEEDDWMVFVVCGCVFVSGLLLLFETWCWGCVGSLITDLCLFFLSLCYFVLAGLRISSLYFIICYFLGFLLLFLMVFAWLILGL